MFSKILIANRGEIACRVAATCRRLGIASVAVYSEADTHAKHVAVCDEAVPIGPAPARDSYLRGAAIIEAALSTGARAVHPGYGFLSENEAFAAACAQAGLAFIGPPASAIAAMGSKAAAKALLGAAGVPLVPGYHGAEQDAALLRREADQIGYPVLLKASAGGGGKGMRIVERGADFAAALASCRREAQSSFGDERMLIEKYLNRPRHIEIQIFADTQGNCVYLFERDCSVQRRHQKVLEEAPAPGLGAARRRAMGEAAVAAARAVGYVGAGTVEFIVEPDGAEGHFYFMEMNTRLQVEHPVTEMVTGLDLVAWQLRVAAGEPLPLAQEALTLSGHAIEARIYAENPAREFLPSTGTLRYLAMPAAVEFTVSPSDSADQGAGQAARAAVRIDSGIRAGDTISPFYDPMLAKLIVWGGDRDQALARMARALREFEVVGLHTNLEFLERIVTSVPFVEADLDTGLIERHHASLFAAAPPPTAETLALAVAALLAREAAGPGYPAPGADPGAAPGHEQPAADRPGAACLSPWARLGGWRLNGPDTRVLGWTLQGAHETDAPPDEIILQSDTDGLQLQIAGIPAAFTWQHGRGADGRHAFSIALDGRLATGRVFAEGNVFHVFHHGRAWPIVWQDPLAHAGAAVLAHGKLTAPMPGKVIAVLAKGGARVEKGAPLLVMEAMKMEHTIAAPADGLVDEVFFAVGDQVQEGAQLLTFSADA